MAVGAGGKCAKFLFILFNILYFLGGCALLAISIWLYIGTNSSENFFTDVTKIADTDDSEGGYVRYALYLATALGGFMFIVGILGFIGACCESKIILGIYIIFLLITIAGEVAAIVVLLFFRDGAIEAISRPVVNSFKNGSFVKVDGDDVKLTADGLLISEIQQVLSCCGINGKDDYKVTKYPEEVKNVASVPYKDFLWSCCKMNDDIDFSDIIEGPTMDKVDNQEKCLAMDGGYFYSQGCKPTAEDMEGQLIFTGVGIIFGILMIDIFGFIFACCLCMNTGKSVD
jgi:hypothetical protein